MMTCAAVAFCARQRLDLVPQRLRLLLDRREAPPQDPVLALQPLRRLQVRRGFRLKPEWQRNADKCVLLQTCCAYSICCAHRKRTLETGHWNLLRHWQSLGLSARRHGMPFLTG